MDKPSLVVLTTWVAPLPDLGYMRYETVNAIREQLPPRDTSIFPCIDLNSRGAVCFSPKSGLYFWCAADLAQVELSSLVAGMDPERKDQRLAWWMKEVSHYGLIIDHTSNKGKYDNALRALDDLYAVQRIDASTPPSRIQALRDLSR